MKRLSTLTTLVAASSIVLGCQSPEEEPTGRPGDGAYRYVLGVNHSGEQIIGGVHEVVEFDTRGKAEAIDWENRAQRLHPELGGLDHQLYDPEIRDGKTNWDVFPSQWWPQSKNGTAWRWQPGAGDDYGDLSDRDRLSPLEKYDVVFYPGQEKVVEAVEHCEYSDFVENGSDECEKIEHPEVKVAGPATAWELKNQGLYQQYDPESWWGHCNGWASYATAEPLGFPKRDVRVKLTDDGKIMECNDEADESCMLFKMADLEALMTELYFSDQATFTGRRCNTRPDEIETDEFGRPEDDACRDLNPGSLHIALTGLLGRGAKHLVTQDPDAKPAFVIDHNYDFEVWNFPLVEFKIDTQEEVGLAEAERLVGASADEEDSEKKYRFNESAVKFVRVKLRYWMVSDSVTQYELLKPADERFTPKSEVELNYVLELDGEGKILGGEWIENPELSWGEDSKKLHPDFAWMAIKASGWGEGNDDLGGNSDNPFVAYSKVTAILRCANDPTTCNVDEGGEEPTETGGLCEDKCGSSSETEAGDVCYCDTVCTQYGDCCPDKIDVCGEA